ncbi:phytanoyl-CoA dioxygenase family protein [Roseomonas hellenica]|uniref:Phytanoyl-CoA dioxygenase family protein n=1 Tax=Plastoroseomonas hellenica TaxID=2687306 RepID=A0ABS5F1J0_9PROT|nr:phytanoyl-CoA dioxygenase family protein [Plastoroseomonas hellenica]MBR0666417.1 phytanoyl-CoA dioxygenase family protein [Plastoroseomonas hellenica]
MAMSERATYARDGFCVVRGAVPPARILALRRAVERVQASVPDLPPPLLERLTFERDLPAENRGGATAAAVGDAIFILGDPPAFDSIFLTLLGEAGILAAVQEALGARAVVAHFMNVTIKHPGFGRAIGWHRDFPNRYACPESSRFLRAMLCLDGMTEAGGATAFIPGSHRIGDAEARVLFAAGRAAPPAPGDAVLACCEPGDLVLIHPKVLHGGGINSAATLRRNIVLQAGDAAAPLLSRPEQETVAGLRMTPPDIQRLTPP